MSFDSHLGLLKKLKKKILTSHLFQSTHQQGYLWSRLSFKKHRVPKANRKYACLLEKNLESLLKLIPGKVAADFAINE